MVDDSIDFLRFVLVSHCTQVMLFNVLVKETNTLFFQGSLVDHFLLVKILVSDFAALYFCRYSVLKKNCWSLLFVFVWESVRGFDSHRGQKILSLPLVVPWFPLLGLTLSGLFMGSIILAL